MERIGMAVGLLCVVLLVVGSSVFASPVNSDASTSPKSTILSQFVVVTTKKVTWAEGLAECRAQNMELASISTRAEQAKIAELTKQARKSSRGGGFWTAGTVKDDNVTVYWNTTGSDLSHFTNWEDGEPRVFSDFRCLLVNGGSRKWMIHNCSATEYFICETF